MRVLVTGGAGFLGSHLVDRLVRLGHTVTVVDNFLTGELSNLADARRSGTLRIIRCDVADTPFGRYEQIYHLASPASPIAYQTYPIETLLTNALGTQRALMIAKRSASRLLLASTSEVYGDPLEHPQAETYWGNVNPIGPRSQYDEGKRFAEALTIAYCLAIGVDARIVRIFNSYGPRMRSDDGRMPSAFIVAALRGDALEVNGTGEQTRSLCYVDDTVRGLMAAMRRGRMGRVYNIGNSTETSVLEFARLVRSETGGTARITHVRARDEEISRRRPDIGRARTELGWRPRVSLHDGLRKTVRYYRRRGDATSR